MPASESITLGILLSLAILAILLELLRFASGRYPLSSRQFGLRMFGGVLILVVVLLMIGGSLFTRPEDGRVFSLFWGFCGLLLLGVLLLLRHDVRTTTAMMKDAHRKMREERLGEIREILARHGKPPPGDRGGSAPNTSNHRASEE